MIRNFLFAVNLLFAFWWKFLASDPEATIEAPSSAKAGEAFTVKVTIKTNGETGFMRYAMEVPADWKAENVEAAGGSFYFEKNSSNDKYSVKYLWSHVGEVPELKITFKLTPSASASGNIDLPNKISHTVNNLPANLPQRTLSVMVSGGTNVINSNPQSNNAAAADSTDNPPAVVSVTRTVETGTTKGEYLVDIIINKDELRSFGKYEDSLPAGFTAKKINTDGGIFTFENGVAKVFWHGMPKKTPLHIQYKIVVSPDVSGVQTIAGHFSYVENNKGKIFRPANSMITIEENPALAQNSTENTNQNNTASQNTTESNTNSNTNNTSTESSNTENTNTASNTQKTENTEATNTTQQNTTENTNTTANNQQTNTTETTNNSQQNNTENTNSQNTATTSTQNSNTNTEQNNTQNTNTTAQNNTEQTNTDTQENTQASNNQKQEQTNTTTSQVNGVTFRVQIAAMARMVPVNYFSSVYSISATINMEQIEGLNKYTTGSFTTYKDARDHREILRNKGVIGPFIAAYSAGRRITVQEALMTTGQKWIA
jgi:hypothetical protein